MWTKFCEFHNEGSKYTDLSQQWHLSAMGERKVFSINSAGSTGYGRKEDWPHLTQFTKINSIRTANINVKHSNIFTGE